MSSTGPSAGSDADGAFAVEFAPTVDEWARYYQFIAAQQRAALLRSTASTRRWLLWVLGLSALMITMQTSLGFVKDPELRWIGSGIVSGVIFWGVLFAIARWLGAAWRKTRHRGVDSTYVNYVRDGVVEADLRTREVRMDSNGLRVAGAMGTMQYPWGEMQRVIVHGEMLMVFTSPQRAVFVPRRAFTSGSQFEDAYGFVQRRVDRGASDEAADGRGR